MIRLRIRRRTLHVLGWIIGGVALIAGLYGLGTVFTVWDDEGRPLFLSPSLRATERYRRRAEKWVDRMGVIDVGLVALLDSASDSDAVALYDQGQDMQEIGEQAAGLVAQIHASEVPVAVVGLREQALTAAEAYLAAAEMTARWLSAPSEAGRREALTALREARALRVELEGSQWLRQN